jgi:hypothetical protein
MSEVKDFYRQRDVSELPFGEEYSIHIECIIMHKTQGLLIRPWNLYHNCFDDSEYDDHFCDKDKVEWWSTMPHFYSDEMKDSLK